MTSVKACRTLCISSFGSGVVAGLIWEALLIRDRISTVSLGLGEVRYLCPDEMCLPKPIRIADKHIRLFDFDMHNTVAFESNAPIQTLSIPIHHVSLPPRPSLYAFRFPPLEVPLPNLPHPATRSSSKSLHNSGTGICPSPSFSTTYCMAVSTVLTSIPNFLVVLARIWAARSGVWTGRRREVVDRAEEVARRRGSC